MSARDEQKAAIEAQQYTPKFVPGVCGNCTHIKFAMELPQWMQRQPGKWGDENRRETGHRCGIGKFPVKKLGSCCEHAFAPEKPSS